MIFIHINKCAGTSIKQCLPKRNKYQRYKHETIADIAKRMPKDEFESTFTFAFIRHPYDRIKSMYFYRKYNLGRHKLRDLSFQDWFYKAFATDFTAVPLMNEPCWTYISIDGELAVDFVGKYERLSEDWKRLQELTGIECDLPAVNKTKRKEQVEYSDDMKRIVREQFEKDFALYS